MERLRRLRTEKGLSQARLAARAELDPSTVNQIERGAREASPATLRKLAGALDVGIVDLLEDTSPKAPGRSSPEPSLFKGAEPALDLDPPVLDLSDKDYLAWVADAGVVELSRMITELLEFVGPPVVVRGSIEEAKAQHMANWKEAQRKGQAHRFALIAFRRRNELLKAEEEHLEEIGAELATA
jgi:transcriptional regulator with XRE-family HTH domain